MIDVKEYIKFCFDLFYEYAVGIYEISEYGSINNRDCKPYNCFVEIDHANQETLTIGDKTIYKSNYFLLVGDFGLAQTSHHHYGVHKVQSMAVGTTVFAPLLETCDYDTDYLHLTQLGISLVFLLVQGNIEIAKKVKDLFDVYDSDDEFAMDKKDIMKLLFGDNKNWTDLSEIIFSTLVKMLSETQNRIHLRTLLEDDNDVVGQCGRYYINKYSEFNPKSSTYHSIRKQVELIELKRNETTDNKPKLPNRKREFESLGNDGQQILKKRKLNSNTNNPSF
eukprot:277816_1